MMPAKIFVISLFCLMVAAKEKTENNFTVGYDPGELLSRIFPTNVAQLRAGYRLIKFENQPELNHVAFDNPHETPSNAKPFKFQVEASNYPETHPDDYSDNNIRFDGEGHITDSIGFQNGHTAIPYGNPSQGIENGSSDSISNENGSGPNGNKKIRRRRRPKQIPGPPGFYPGPAPFPGPSVGPNYIQPGNNGQFYRPPRRPRPSIAADALSAVTGALTSIAENDDYECVARLLCEAAAGGALGGSSLLDSVSGLQPLLTLLSAYNGISSNPLFVFGRAAFLGMSSKNSPGSCRYAYPLCPTDPEQLVHYLNNHNGGFFRFFSTPQQGQQNLQQFYNQLSQNYGLYQPNPGSDQGHYGFLNPGQFLNGQPNLYPNGYQQNYGLAYPYNQNYGNGIRFKTNKETDDTELYDNGNKIEKRIQNKPASFLNDNSDEHNSKWLFPGEDDENSDESSVDIKYTNLDDFKTSGGRKGKALRFPDTYTYTRYLDTYNSYNIDDNNRNPKLEYHRKQKAISFPERLSHNYVNSNNNYEYIPNPAYNSNNNNIVFNNKRSMRYNYNQNNDNIDEPGVTTVYVVRGNGDPSKPEIVKLRPGETL